MQLIQYLRPNGRPVKVETTLPPEYEARVITLAESGWIFSCELLSCESVVLYAEHMKDPENAITRLCDNGPAVEDALKSLIDEACAAK